MSRSNGCSEQIRGRLHIARHSSGWLCSTWIARIPRIDRQFFADSSDLGSRHHEDVAAYCTVIKRCVLSGPYTQSLYIRLREGTILCIPLLVYPWHAALQSSAAGHQPGWGADSACCRSESESAKANVDPESCLRSALLSRPPYACRSKA